MTVTVAHAAHFSTSDVDEADRSSRWEAWNRAALVGLHCRTPHGGGLRGEEVTLDLDRLTLGHVHAAPHRIARTAATVDDSPTRAVVVYAVLRGRTTFADTRGTHTVAAGDVVVLDADQPFERTFPTTFTELALKLPRHHLDVGPAAGGAHVVRPSGVAARRVRALGRHLAHPPRPLDPADADTITTVALDLVTDLTAGARSGDRLALGRLLVEQALDDPLLSAPELAAALEVSERQLSRLFARSGTTFPRYLNERRVRRAEILLRERPRLPVGEIAARCGFASASYFSRVFRDHHGVPPQEFAAD